MSVDIEQLSQQLLGPPSPLQRRALAKAITLVESKLVEHRSLAQQLLATLLPHGGNSVRVGITGIPGVGKSTFIESLGLHISAQGKRVAVLAVDPSSPLRGGSILGDKTRMESLAREPNAFIRPSPAEGSLGGVAQYTRETMQLCDAAGYDIILVETVGVGQSEYQVASMTDFFLVLMLPNAGDELQGIKRGIMELADALVINKADGESLALAEQSRNQYQNALHLLRCNEVWTPKVLCCSALHQQGIDQVWEMIVQYLEDSQQTGYLDQKRAKQNIQYLDELIQAQLRMRFEQHEQIKLALPKLRQAVLEQQLTPNDAMSKLFELL